MHILHSKKVCINKKYAQILHFKNYIWILRSCGLSMHLYYLNKSWRMYAYYIPKSMYKYSILISMYKYSISCLIVSFLVRHAFGPSTHPVATIFQRRLYLYTFFQIIRSRSAGIISRLKNTVGWFFMREKYCSGWKNKLNKTDYKPDEQGLSMFRYNMTCLLNFLGHMTTFFLWMVWNHDVQEGLDYTRDEYGTVK
jgi:hypothetical protein